MMLLEESQAVNELAQALQVPENFAKMGPGFALLKPGDWQGLIDWAASFGYPMTLEQLYHFCSANTTVLDQMSGSSHLSAWNIDSLRKAATGG